MSHLNVEIKARCAEPQKLRERLIEMGAVSHGMDHQTDTYFNIPSGRLKLRQGNIENNLIFYQRADQAGPKKADIHLYQPGKSEDLRQLLLAGLGEKITINKEREILFIDNVKFHIDQVSGLGSFMEIEAIDKNGDLGENTIREQCEYYTRTLKIDQEDLITCSYSDLLLQKQREE